MHKNWTSLTRLAATWKDQFEEDYKKLEKFERKLPNNNQNSYGPGWKAIPIKFRGKFSRLADKIPQTKDFVSGKNINSAVFAVLYPYTFVHPNDNIYDEGQTVYHVPIITPGGDIGIKFENCDEIFKWLPFQILEHKADEMYCAWNFTPMKRVMLHLTYED